MPASSIRNDPIGRAFCAHPRRNHAATACDTMVARLAGDELIVRCRSCKQDHRFRVVDGQIRAVSQPVAPARAPAPLRALTKREAHG